MKILKYSHSGGKEANLHFAQAIKQKVFDLWKGTQFLRGILFGKHQSSCDFKMKLPSFLCLGLIFMSFSSNAQIYFEEYYREKEAFEEKIKSEESAGNTQLAMQIREKMIDFILRHEGKLSPDYAPAIEELCNTSYFEKTSKAAYYRKENERLKIEDERFGEELRKRNEIIDNDKKTGAIDKLFGDYRDLLLFLMREQPKHIYVTNEMKNILSNDEILDETKKFKILEDFLTNVLPIDKVVTD